MDRIQPHFFVSGVSSLTGLIIDLMLNTYTVRVFSGMFVRTKKIIHRSHGDSKVIQYTKTNNLRLC